MIEAARAELARLREEAEPLEPGASERSSIAAAAFAHSERFLSDLPEGPSYRPWPGPAAHPPRIDFPEEGRSHALRLWLPLQLAGVGAFRAAQSEKIALARYFHRRLSEMPGWETGPAPDLSITAFRYRPAGGNSDDFNRRLLRRLQEEGRVFLSGTRIGGADWLRCAILSFRTHIEHVDETLEVLTRLAAELEAE